MHPSIVLVFQLQGAEGEGAHAAAPASATPPAALDPTSSPLALLALAVFVLAYVLVVTEDLIKLRKSKPVILGAGAIWLIVALAHGSAGADRLAKHHVEEYGELFLFLMVAMTYISAITERNVFAKLNALLVSAGMSLRGVFWATGTLAFLISPFADNLTTALLMGAVVVTVGHGNVRFISASCINVVVAANAGGAFSPFGDITTLMVWVEGKVPTSDFLWLIPPSLVNWLVPAIPMSLTVPKQKPEPLQRQVELREGWLVVVLLFMATIATAVLFHLLLHLPPFLGMTTGLGYYMLYCYWMQQRRHRPPDAGFDVLKNVAEVEWDTLLFFFGVIMCVGGLQELGYLTKASQLLYDEMGAFTANVGVGLVSAVLDNVPVMFAVLGMKPQMDLSEWLLVTLTAGVGGSMLSIGSAAGVALMGTAHGRYTFGSHLRWTPLIAVGYAASVGTHWLMWRYLLAVDAA